MYNETIRSICKGLDELTETIKGALYTHELTEQERQTLTDIAGELLTLNGRAFEALILGPDKWRNTDGTPTK